MRSVRALRTHLPKIISFTVAVIAAVTATTATGYAAETTAVTYKPAVIGLGDSVAAGYGAGPFATSPNAAACERTTKGYPTLLQAPPYINSYNLACAGATASAGLNGSQTRNGVTIPSQISQLNALPKNPLLVTLTVGANDVHWNDFLGLCLLPNTPTPDAPGCNTDENTGTFTALLNAAKPQIQQTITAIKARQPLRVVITGYYDPFGNSASSFGLSDKEIEWYRARITQLNDTLNQLAVENHIAFAKATSLDATKGDVILSTDPLNTYGFAHPTAQGQVKLSKAVLKSLL